MLHLAFTCSNSAKKTRNMLIRFIVNIKDTKAKSAASIVNFEHILYSTLLLNLNNGSDNILDNVFSNCEKYIVLWDGKICWTKCFHPHSLKVRLRKYIFSRGESNPELQTISKL